MKRGSKKIFSTFKKKNLKSGMFFIVIATILLFLSFFFNIFGVGYSNDWFQNYQIDSSRIVEKTAQCKDSSLSFGPLLVKNKSDADLMSIDYPGCEDAIFRPYYSQFGLQARVISSFAPVNDGQLRAYFTFVQILLALLSAFVFAAFCLKVRELFGTWVGYATLVGVSLSVWIVAYARNMYWVEFLMFLPFIFGFLFYQYFREKKKLLIFYVVLGTLFFVKLLNGYEHVSTMLVSAFVPVVFYEILENQRQLKVYMLAALRVLGVGVVALGMAITLNTITLTSYYGSTSKAFSMVMGRVEYRAASNLDEMQAAVVWGFEDTSPELYKLIDHYYDLDALKEGNGSPIKYAALSVLNYAVLPAITIPLVFHEPFGSIIQSIAFLVIVTCFTLLYLNRRAVKSSARDRRMIRALTWAYYIGLAGSISWLVLMPGHAYPHAHLNGIIFYMPTILLSFIILSLCVLKIISNRTYARKI